MKNKDFNRQRIDEAIFALSPDVVILTEYLMEDAQQETFTESLRQHPNLFLFSRISVRDAERSRFEAKPPINPGQQNRVAIFSKYPLEDGIEPANDHVLSARSNYLHVRLPTLDLDIVGLRVPWYKINTFERHDRRLYIQWLHNQLLPLAKKRTAVIGDFNFDPHARTVNYYHEWMRKEFARTLNASLTWSDDKTAWQYISPIGCEPSHIKGGFLDHAMVSKFMPPTHALPYISECQEIGWRLRGIKKSVGMPDHAMFCIEIDLE